MYNQKKRRNIDYSLINRQFYLYIIVYAEWRCLFLYRNILGFDKERFKMFFSFDSIFGIFRSREKMGFTEESSECDLLSVKMHNCVVPFDVLRDIIFLHRSGLLQLERNDVVCVRINGFITNFRYNGRTIDDPSKVESYFRQIKGFTKKEKAEYVEQIHSENKVLSVLDGKTYSLEMLNGSECTLYAIDSEFFFREKNGYVVADYSLYKLDHNEIRTENINCKPFQMIKNALFYFQKDIHAGKKKKNVILLLDRKELEMVMDYSQLQKLIV